MTDEDQVIVKSVLVKQAIKIEKLKEKLAYSEKGRSDSIRWYQEEKEKLIAAELKIEERLKGVIVLSPSENQSGFNRVAHAQGLIMQLSERHDGRNTWLLNYGTNDFSTGLRKSKGLSFDETTHSCETITSK